MGADNGIYVLVNSIIMLFNGRKLCTMAGFLFLSYSGHKLNKHSEKQP